MPELPVSCPGRSHAAAWKVGWQATGRNQPPSGRGRKNRTGAARPFATSVLIAIRRARGTPAANKAKHKVHEENDQRHRGHSFLTGITRNRAGSFRRGSHLFRRPTPAGLGRFTSNNHCPGSGSHPKIARRRACETDVTTAAARLQVNCYHEFPNASARPHRRRTAFVRSR